MPSRHSNRDLPTLVFGGGFKHKGHLSFDHNSSSSPLLGDLYLSIMQKLGLEVSEFSNANKNLNGHFKIAGVFLLPASIFASPIPEQPYALIERYCLDCHDSDTQKEVNLETESRLVCKR